MSKSNNLPANFKEQMVSTIEDILEKKLKEHTGELMLARNDMIAHMDRVREDGYSLKENIDMSKKLAERTIKEMHDKITVARSAARTIDDKFSFTEGLDKVKKAVNDSQESLLPRLQQIEIDYARVISTEQEIKDHHERTLNEIAPPLFTPFDGGMPRYFMMSTYHEIPEIKAVMESYRGKEKASEFKILAQWEPREIKDSKGNLVRVDFYISRFVFINKTSFLGRLSKIESLYDGKLPFPVVDILSCGHEITEDHRHRHPNGNPFGEDDICQNHDSKCSGCYTCDSDLEPIREFLKMKQPQY